MKIDNIDYVENPIQHGGNRLKNNFERKSFKQPLITVITVVLNGEKNLEDCFRSLHQQKYENIEHIVIDGGSTDNTINIIKSYENKIDYWCQKKDEGIYDAFNIGMRLAKGEYIGFLNSDDQYAENAFVHLHKYIEKYPTKDFIFGSVKKHWGVLHGYRPYKIKWSWGFYSSHSTGFFIKLQSAKKIGCYNLKYKYSADYDYFYRMIVKHKLVGVGTKKNELFGYFRRGGFSSKIKFKDHFFEEINIRLDNKQNRLLVLIIFIYKYFKHFNKI